MQSEDPQIGAAGAPMVSLGSDRASLLRRCDTRRQTAIATLSAFSIWLVGSALTSNFWQALLPVLPWSADVALNAWIHRRGRRVAEDPTSTDADVTRALRASRLGYVSTSVLQSASLCLGVISLDNGPAVALAAFWLPVSMYNTLAVHEELGVIVARISLLCATAVGSVSYRLSDEGLELTATSYAVAVALTVFTSVQTLAIMRSTYRSLIEEQSTVNTAFFSIRDGIAILGADARIHRCNQRFRELAGSSLDDADHLEFDSDPSDGDEIDIDGRTINVSIQPTDDSLPGWITMLLRDVTQLRMNEQQSVRNASLATVGTLASGLAHDFNNLLMVIGGNVSLVADARNLTELQSKRLDAVSTAIDHGSALTTNLMALTHETSSDHVPTSVRSLLESIVDLSQTAFGHSSVVRLECSTDAWVLLDKAAAQSAILNLLLNAREAMGGEGEIRLAASDIAECAATSDAGAHVAIEVADTGTGMSPEVLSRATEVYFTTKRTSGGTGLGLAMVAAFASQSGGRLVIESKEHVGATITLVLPTADRRATSGDHGGEAVDAAGLRVLVIEDDPEVSLVLASMVRRHGAYAETVESVGSLAALPVEHVNSFDVALCDYVLAGHNAFDALEVLAGSGWSGFVAIVSGNLDKASASRLRAMDVSRILAKPVNADQLGQLLSEAKASLGR